MIIDRLIKKIKETNNPTVVGLDPSLDFVPQFIKNAAFSKHGETLEGASEAFYDFNKILIDEIHDLIPAVKPQVAMYEQYGASGISAYIKTVKYAKSKNLIVIGDIKRGDIASTAKAYSDGHIGRVEVGNTLHEVFNEDMITLSPYLGYDSIEPYIENCKIFEKGLFILVKTSNKNSGEIQDIEAGNEFIYEKIGKLVSNWGKNCIGKYGYSDIGAVVGATHPNQAKKLRELMPNTFFLVPGYGAQGGKAEDLAVCFDKNGMGAIVNSSRGIIAAYQMDIYKDKFEEKDFAKAAREAIICMKNDINKFII